MMWFRGRERRCKTLSKVYIASIFQAISKIDTNLYNVLIHFSFMSNDFCRSIHFTPSQLAHTFTFVQKILLQMTSNILAYFSIPSQCLPILSLSLTKQREKFYAYTYRFKWYDINPIFFTYTPLSPYFSPSSHTAQQRN